MIAKTAIIENAVALGINTWIWDFTKIREKAVIGNNVSIGQNCYIDEGVTIGNGCRIQNNVSVYKCVTLEDEVFLGPSAVVLNDINPRAGYSKGGDVSKYKNTLIKKGASIGGNATILPGVTIGEYALVGAGSVVVNDIKDHEIVVGNPAEVIGIICKCGESRWKFNNLRIDCYPLLFKCDRCGFNISYPF